MFTFFFSIDTELIRRIEQIRAEQAHQRAMNPNAQDDPAPPVIQSILAPAPVSKEPTRHHLKGGNDLEAKASAALAAAATDAVDIENESGRPSSRQRRRQSGVVKNDSGYSETTNGTTSNGGSPPSSKPDDPTARNTKLKRMPDIESVP